MKISELITQLQAEQQRRGDIEIEVMGCYYDYTYAAPRPRAKIIDAHGVPLLLGCAENGDESPRI